MSVAFSEKKAKVIVVDPSGPVRQLMADAVRSIGFANVEGKASVEDALAHLEVEHADWLILPLKADAEVNAMQLINLCSQVPLLKKVRISLFLEEDERYVLPSAYEAGILSHHAKPITKESLATELTALMERLEQTKWNEAQTAATYLREHFKATANHPARIDLEKCLIKSFPGDTAAMLSLADAFHQTGKTHNTKRTLAQVALIDSSKATEVQELAKGYFGEDADLTAGESGDFNILGLGTCLIVDSDDAVRGIIEKALTEIGVKNVVSFADGAEAASWVESNDEPDLIIHEWRLPSLSGPLFIQRVRAKGFYRVPLVVISSLLKPDDMPLVREMGIAEVVAKPLKKENLLPALVWTVQQERSPTDHQAKERKIRALIKSGELEDAQALINEYISSGETPLARKRLVEAEIAFAKEDYTLARAAAFESLRLAGDTIILLNLLGKTFMKLADYASALKCFNKAQKLSPRNVERLCDMAEVHTELGNTEEADDAIEDASTLDPDSVKVEQAKINCAISKGDTAAAQKLMSEVESLSEIVAYMNNKAVAHAKCGHTEEAIEVYQNTAASIPDSKADIRAIVLYNTALAQIRADDYPAALASAELAGAVKGSKVSNKVRAILTRLKKSIKDETPITLATSDVGQGKTDENSKGDATEGLADESDYAALANQIEARPGDICCFLIYSAGPFGEPKAIKIGEKVPKFKRRAAISREESFGAEMSNKAG